MFICVKLIQIELELRIGNLWPKSKSITEFKNDVTFYRIDSWTVECMFAFGGVTTKSEISDCKLYLPLFTHCQKYTVVWDWWYTNMHMHTKDIWPDMSTVNYFFVSNTMKNAQTDFKPGFNTFLDSYSILNTLTLNLLNK